MFFRTKNAAHLLWSLYLGTAFIMLGNGLQSSFLGIRSTDEFGSPLISGFIMAGYALGFLISSITAPKLIQRVGHIRVFAAFTSLASIGVLLHILFIDYYLWTFFRFITGFSYGVLYIVIESWINNVATNDIRGRLFGFYMTISYLLVSIGQVGLYLYDPSGNELFILSSVSISIAIIPIMIADVRGPKIESFRPFSLFKIYSISPLSVVISFFAGLIVGSTNSMGAVYAKLAGFSINEIIILTASANFFPVIAMMPIGYISDKFDRRAVLIVILVIIIISALLSIEFNQTLYIFPLFMVTLGLCHPIYSLGVSHVNDLVSSSDRIGVSATIVLLYGAGAFLAPTIVGVMLEVFGPNGYFLFLIICSIILAIYCYMRLRVREIDPALKGEFVTVTSRSSTIANIIVSEEASRETVKSQKNSNKEQ